MDYDSISVCLDTSLMNDPDVKRRGMSRFSSLASMVAAPVKPMAKVTKAIQVSKQTITDASILSF